MFTYGILGYNEEEGLQFNPSAMLEQGKKITGKPEAVGATMPAPQNAVAGPAMPTAQLSAPTLTSSLAAQPPPDPNNPLFFGGL